MNNKQTKPIAHLTVSFGDVLCPCLVHTLHLAYAAISDPLDLPPTKKKRKKETFFFCFFQIDRYT